MERLTGGLDAQRPQRGLDLDALYRLHAPGAVRFAYLLTGERELSQDLVQDAFARVSGQLEKLETPAAFPAYLRTTILNLVKMHIRRRGVERNYLTRRGPDPSPAERSSDATYIEMREILLRLPYRQRAAIVLRYYEDLPEKEIARLLGCRPGTVKSSLSRGLAALRTQNDPNEGRDADAH